MIVGCEATSKKTRYKPTAMSFLPGAAGMWQNASTMNTLRDFIDSIPLRKSLVDLLGVRDLLLGPRVPLAPETLWKRDIPEGSIEKVRIQLEPGVSTCLYVCLPAGAKGPQRPFICLQGHSTGMHTSIAVEWRDETVPKAIGGDRDFAIGCLRRGIAAVCLEQRYMGENSTRPDHTPDCAHYATICLLSGRTALGERVFDVDRAIDYLSTRPDFDLSQVGVMGNSGGGTTSMFAGAVLPRLTHVMPSCSFSSFRASIGTIHHCVCNYVPRLYELGESADVLGLIAPRPLVIVNGRLDDIFPLDAANEQFARLEAIYAAAGAVDRVRHVVGPEGHRFYVDPAWAEMLPLWRGNEAT